MQTFRSRAFASLLALAILPACDSSGSVGDILSLKRHSIASTSMEPTLVKGTAISSYNVELSEVRRGDILIIETERYGDYVYRLIGLPGDTIEMKQGLIELNGETITQAPAGRWKIHDPQVGGEFSAFSEILPGMKEPYRVLDQGLGLGDNMPPLKLPADRYFFMGDNRDNAADSRFSGNTMGLGLVAGSQIKGRVDPVSIN